MKADWSRGIALSIVQLLVKDQNNLSVVRASGFVGRALFGALTETRRSRPGCWVSAYGNDPWRKKY
jgi:hypothetical protein